jgi:sRNA-binding carbon storage regulator CsrA
MLVLNRRPGESIIIEPGLVVTVLSVAERRVWIAVDGPGLPALRACAVATGATSARLEVGPVAAVSYEGESVSVAIATGDHPAVAPVATLALSRNPGERILLDQQAWVGIASVAKGNPCLELGGADLDPEVRITLIRPAGNYVRLGVDAPERRVYRRELWESVQAGEPPSGGAVLDGQRAEGHVPLAPPPRPTVAAGAPAADPAS